MNHTNLLAVLAFALTATPALSRDLADPHAVLAMIAPTDRDARRPTPRPPGQGNQVIFGPFVVVDAGVARLRGITDSRSPAAFRAMLRRHPGIRILEMRLCQGTVDDQANLELGRLIRASGISTFIPDTGFVGSGAVELFLAGARRMVSPSAEFGVHSWRDTSGREPADYQPDAPPNRVYLDYYRAMGMSDAGARNFYAMSNSVPNAQARYLSAAQMRRWIDFELVGRER